MPFRVLNICFSIICYPGTCRTSWSWRPSKLTAHASWSTSTASITTTPQTSLTSPLAMSSLRRLLRSSGSSMWTHQQCRYILSLKCHLWPEIYSIRVHECNCSSCFCTYFLFLVSIVSNHLLSFLTVGSYRAHWESGPGLWVCRAL